MKKSTPIWMTIAIALIAFVAGLFIDLHHANTTPNASESRNPKIKAVIDFILSEYVDTLDPEELVERNIPMILRGLDPHASYFDAHDSKITQNKADGVVPDIGIVFISVNDTIFVECTVPNGPSDKAGIMPGDRIMTIDGKSIINKNLNTGQITKLMCGPDGSKVTISVKRNGTPKTIDVVVTRDRIRERTIEPPYMLDKSTGYIKVNQFASNSYKEFVRGLNQLQQEGAKRFMIDLRGNGGGYVEMAVLMANEFLSAGQPIVSTHGRHKQDDLDYKADGKGKFQNVEIAVLIDEFSASSSEIFAGAIQDNDRGLIVGRRSYGKGLVQNDFTLPDSSVIRLAVARYYTPSGRCIQKDYKRQGIIYYDFEVPERYRRGEVYNRDSIVVDKSKKFTTRHGRTVYGGGGIIPDIFVPYNSDGITKYYTDVENAGLLQRFTFAYCENNRSTLKQMNDYKQFLRTTPIDDALIKEFADFAAENGVAPHWFYIKQSQNLILTRLKAMIARDVFGPMTFNIILNRNDNTVREALRALNRHKATFPITE